MLTQLTVSNYAIAERVELQFGKGMTALTGETGAGKSIVLWRQACGYHRNL